ncbi:hypothetical protein PHYBOEH_005073 [Phytophthora boehmeriae]|uniref:Ribosome biogenesis protein NOP53 n=1 Tax=Phytophthora boehmeriae TaxID=109152 RepID=A0A8T1WPP6_9STRA|nr:hypothetical protein PHYBOEH_005073 [Phytophthora boehmeriae]
MGGSKRRRQQRVKAIGAQVEESIRQDAEDKKLKHVEAEQLFQVDSKGGDVGPPVTKKQKLEKLQKDPILAGTRKFDASKLNKGEALAVKKLQQQSQQQKPAVKAKKSSNLWGQDGAAKEDEANEKLDAYVAPVVAKKIKRRKRSAPSTQYKMPTVEVAAAGQSYHPDFETHQDVMAEAVAQELERQEKRAKAAEPLTKGLSEETLQYIKMDSSDEEGSDSSDDEDVSKKPRKTPSKVTRTMRNKRERHKKMEMEHQARRGEKSIIKQINASQHILQSIVKSEKAAAQKQELKKLQKEQKLQEEPLVRVGGKHVKLERETPVSFSEELTGNMRTLKPKGHPLLDRFDSLHKRNKIDIGRPKKTRKAKVKIIEAKK